MTVGLLDLSHVGGSSVLMACLVGIGSALTIYTIRRIQRYRQFVKHVNALPGPPWKDLHFFYGHIKSLLDTVGTIPNRPKVPYAVGWFFERIPGYKEDGIFRVWVFHPYYVPFLARTTVMILHPKLVRQLLTEKANQQKIDKEKRIYTIAKSLVGSSFLALSDGPKWKHQRKMVAPAFNSSFLQHVHDTVFDLLENHFFPRYDKCEENGSNEFSHRLETMEWSARLALDVMGLASFSCSFGGLESFAGHGKSLNSTDNRGENLYDTYGTILSILGLRNTPSLPFRQYLPTEENRRFRRATNRLNGVIRDIVKERLRVVEERERTAQIASTNGDTSTTHKDILSYMLERDPETNERMSFDSLFANVRMLLFAGHDTTAATVAWALWELSNNQGIQEKLYAEIRDVMNKKENDGKTSYKTIASLPYLDAVVRESLRLHCPAPVARVAIDDIELQHPMDSNRTIFIPTGTKMYILPMYGQRMYTPEWGPNGSVGGDSEEEYDSAMFQPDRFLRRDEETEKSGTNKEWFFPFSVGPRNW